MNVLKGFIVGVFIILGAFLFTFMVTYVILWQTGNKPPLHHGMHILITGWFLMVLILIPLGSLPVSGSAAASMARWAFVWLPISLGWFGFSKFGGPFFLIGTLISSTSVGYNVVVNYYKMTHKKKGG